MIVFVRGIFQDEIFEDILFCKTFKTSTKGEDIFKLLGSFSPKNQLEWKNCLSGCLNGAKAMSSHITGLASHAKEVSTECKLTHRVLHWEAFMAKNLYDELKDVL